ncbi:mannose-6-phosphate isomerase, type 1 [Frankia sp. EI5c]|uniref:mannose-6-phosphate isomerase, class I n=1 Tax=Frankia sp. EI5c TaxID=683316 RepID=UPI0007C2AA57|nr:mannose-6-phosphate isomerase, class I [Frankia sp. EI5c]OAA18420.1 mannose-6-phosphate isomerase, type 1 [Frankia sp. EI5c]
MTIGETAPTSAASSESTNTDTVDADTVDTGTGTGSTTTSTARPAGSGAGAGAGRPQNPVRVLELHGQAQHYAWGSATAIPDLLGVPPDGEPVAELWLGTHPQAPAEVVDPAEIGGVAAARLSPQRRASDLGARRAAADLVGELPFLLKVLAADKALSLQVHPDLDQARSGFEADEAAGLPAADPRRRYRDRNHKPELIVALTPFRALAGIRAPAATLAIARGLGHPGLIAAFAPLATDPTGGATQVLRSLLTLPPQAGVDLAAGVVSAAERVSSDAPEELRRAADLVRLLAATHPGDVGIAAALLLNDVTLAPGEGLFQPARLLHAYVQGVGIEIMATSDNVLRGGLTPKHIDVDELLRILDPRPTGAPVLRPRTLASSPGGLLRCWEVPVEDFVLREAVCTGGPVAVSNPSILLAVEGQVEITGSDGAGASLEPLTLRRGCSALVTGPATVVLTGTGRVFAAGSPTPV